MHAICGARHTVLNGILGSKFAPTPRLGPRDLTPEWRIKLPSKRQLGQGHHAREPRSRRMLPKILKS
jgi:hypothetical protein